MFLEERVFGKVLGKTSSVFNRCCSAERVLLVVEENFRDHFDDGLEIGESDLIHLLGVFLEALSEFLLVGCLLGHIFFIHCELVVH